ncbi:hypothetical protein KAX08_06540 [candidate division WOR-3 bacterium]|nr:hypothetical protein [candidate division WOR-3 bacterium]
MSQILQKLKGGDLRSFGRSEEVVQDILRNPSLFCKVFEGMLNEDPVVRMRSVDALEKVSSKYPKYLKTYKDRLINEVCKIKQQEVRWHVAQMFSYLELNKEEKEKIIKILSSWIDSEKSNIVKVFSMQTLANLAKKDDNIKKKIVKKFEKIMKTGSPAVVNRGNKLLRELKE